MTRVLSFILAAMLALTLDVVAGNVRAGIEPEHINPKAAAVSISQDVPKTATVEIVLLTAPGINDRGTRWEIAYQFRIINQADDWLAWNQRTFKAESGNRLGELIKEGAIKGMLRPPANREVVLHIPFTAEIQERLRNQPKEWAKITPGHITPEQIRLSQEQETKTQIFLFYPIITVYDAKLKKNIIIEALRAWTFADYRQAKFKITLEIHEDGSYSTKSSLPTKVRSN
jgi:hypothetical protein